MTTMIKDMNDVIDRLTSFVESQYPDKSKILEGKLNINISTGNESGNNLSWSEVTKVPNNTEIHNALNEVLIEVDRIANQPFEFPPLVNDHDKSSESIQQMFKKSPVEKDQSSPTPRSKVNIEDLHKPQSRNVGVYRICRDKQFGTYEKEMNAEVPHKTMINHLKTAQRLFETQMNYDRNLEELKYQITQNILSLNKSKPSINSNSASFMTKNMDWKPISIRTPEVIQKANRDKEKLREQVTQERLRKEAEELEEVERTRFKNQIKAKTKTKAKVKQRATITEDEWLQYYNMRFNGFSKNKSIRLQMLDERWNKPNQGRPSINKTSKRTELKDKNSFVEVSDRLIGFVDLKGEKLKALESSLTPKFKPRINKNTEKILKNSSKKSRNIQLRLRQYNSVNVVSSLTQRFNNKLNTEDFSDIVQEHSNKNNSLFQSKGADEGRTKMQTFERTSAMTYNTNNVFHSDDFKTFIDTYEESIKGHLTTENRTQDDVAYDSNKFELFNQEDEDRVRMNEDLNYGTIISQSYQSESYNDREENSEEENYYENKSKQADDHMHDEESKHNESSTSSQNQEVQSNTDSQQEITIRQSVEAHDNEITIRDIMNPNLDSLHSFRPKSKTSRSSRAEGSNNGTSKRDSKGSVFEYQNTKNSKGSNIESLKAQSSKRPSGVMQSLQPLSNRDIERSMTAINRNKSKEGSVKMLGSSKRGSDKLLEVINEHHSELLETPTPAKQDREHTFESVSSREQVILHKLNSESDFIMKNKLERNITVKSKQIKSQDGSVKLNDSMNQQNCQDDFKDIISEHDGRINAKVPKEIEIDINLKKNEELSQKLGSVKSKDSRVKINKAGYASNRPPVHRHSLYNKVENEVRKIDRRAMSERGHPSVPRVLTTKNKSQVTASSAEQNKSQKDNETIKDSKKNQVVGSKASQVDLKSIRSMQSKREILEQNFEKILSTVSDDPDRSMQIRVLLEKLLNYAMNDKSMCSDGSANDLNSSIQSIKFPQHLIDELEELGFNILMLVDGIIDQYSYLFSKRKRPVKKSKNIKSKVGGVLYP